MGRRQTIIGHTVNPDDIPPMQFFDNTFEDVTLEGFATLMDVDEKWGNVKDCGIGFPCTAPQNVLYSFKRNNYVGPQPPQWSGKPDF